MIRAILLFLTLAVGLFAGLVHLRADPSEPTAVSAADHAALAAAALRQNHTPPIALFMRSP